MDIPVADPDPSVFSENGVVLPDSDLTIISSDGIKFLVHKRRVGCASEIFDNMLEDGSPGGEVTLVESAAVLARLLPFAYPAIVRPFKIEFPEDRPFVQAIHKYQMSRGAESVAQSLYAALHSAGDPSLEFAVRAAQAASHASDALLCHLWLCHTLPYFKNDLTTDNKIMISFIEDISPDLAAQLMATVSGYILDTQSILSRSRAQIVEAASKHKCGNANALELWWRKAEDWNTAEDLRRYSDVDVPDRRVSCIVSNLCSISENAKMMRNAAEEVAELRMTLIC